MLVKDKLTQIIKFLMDGIGDLTESLDATSKSITSFQKSLVKVKKDLKRVKEIKVKKGVSATVEPTAPVVTGGKAVARDKAASLLFNMLSTTPAEAGQAPTSLPPVSSAAPPSGPPRAGPPSGPPKGPPKAGPPKGPPKAGPPSGPPKGPPSAPSKGASKGPPSKLPPPPKLPPAPGSAGPPSGPPGAIKTPSFAQRPVAPSGSPAAAPAAASGNSEPGLGGLRDEMLKELERLKKIMRGS